MPTKSFCAHGHFYQPPRIDPFTNQIPQEFGAAPHGNWTEKIFYQCYEPNASLGNFRKISFNIGPTLFSWLDENHPETVRRIVEQENHTYKHTGVSNAMAHPYFHLIFPLASRRDKDTMLAWGIRDYVRHFNHPPAGCWLPETAVDLPSLETLTDHGIAFTILAPWQAQDENIDTTQPYRVTLQNGREITVFFYNGYLSSELSFDPSATVNADAFVHDWLIPQIEFLDQDRDEMFIGASDGELYGHHQPFREKFLSHLVDGAVEGAGIVKTFPALWLRDHPALAETFIQENTSWSCHHGIERWRDACGDAPTATWKKPLRRFMDALCMAVDDIYERELYNLVMDPWNLRDGYIEVLMGEKSAQDFIQSHAKIQLNGEQVAKVDTLLQAQFERLRMLSSDAWFFYDLDRIEPLNALKYAAHAVSLVESVTGLDPSDDLIPILAEARSELSGVTGEICFLGYLKKFERRDR